MKVIATGRGIFGKGNAQVRYRGDGTESFDIPDEPRRKAKPNDKVEEKIADKEGKVPVAFSSAWMAPAAPDKGGEKPTGNKKPDKGGEKPTGDQEVI